MIIKLNEILVEKNKSQYWLAKETGIAASTINNLCNNKTSSIKFTVLDKICKTLDCEISDILVTDNNREKRLLQYSTYFQNTKKKEDET